MILNLVTKPTQRVKTNNNGHGKGLFCKKIGYFKLGTLIFKYSNAWERLRPCLYEESEPGQPSWPALSGWPGLPRCRLLEPRSRQAGEPASSYKHTVNLKMKQEMSRATPVKRASSANRVAHLITSYKQDLNLIENNEGVEKISNMVLSNTWETFCLV